MHLLYARRHSDTIYQSMSYFSTKPTSVSDWLQQAAKRLVNSGSESARLDAELLLASVLSHDRTWLHAHPEWPLTLSKRRAANRLIAKRLNHVPVAYLTGHKDFYGRDFLVNHYTLVPRPESEDMIELLKQLVKPSHRTLIDVGTGSGCLGISSKLELPRLETMLTDISRPALRVARANARRLSAEVMIRRSNLLTNYKGRVDIILANLPYVNRGWTVSPSTKHEPSKALFADLGGLKIIFQLLEQASQKLSPGGLIILEADPTQHQAIVDQASELKLKKVAVLGYQIAFTKA